MNLASSQNSPFHPAAIQLEHSFFTVPAECPYGQPCPATYRLARFDEITVTAMEFLLGSGYRRNGNVLYTMQCQGCNGCTPIRLRPSAFSPNRNQKRVLKKNRGITAEIAPPRMEDSNLALLEKFLAARYPQPTSSADGYYSAFFLNTLCNTMTVDYRIHNTLVGTSIIDIGDNWLNAVYCYFDPDLHKHSLGTYNILYLVDLCRRNAIEYLYLGYWIHNVRAMCYKANFKPNEILINGEWKANQQPLS